MERLLGLFMMGLWVSSLQLVSIQKAEAKWNSTAEKEGKNISTHQIDKAVAECCKKENERYIFHLDEFSDFYFEFAYYISETKTRRVSDYRRTEDYWERSRIGVLLDSNKVDIFQSNSIDGKEDELFGFSLDSQGVSQLREILKKYEEWSDKAQELGVEPDGKTLGYITATAWTSLL